MLWDVTITDNTGTEYPTGVEAKSRAAALDKARQFFNRQMPPGCYAVGPGVAVRRDAPRRRTRWHSPAKYHQLDPAKGFKINFAPTKP